jgi:large subunit ribosomal protein L3
VNRNNDNKEWNEYMQGLIGRKIGMTRMFEKETGKAFAVTVIQAANNVVHQVKTKEKDGYCAVQLGFEPVAEKRVTKPILGHCKKHGSAPTRIIKEFPLDSADEKVQPGTSVGVESLENVKIVDVIGISKGRGFAGTIKRHHFMRGRESHGSGCTRERGSMGSNTFPAHVWPGLRMSGHMGSAQVTAKNVELMGIDKEAGLVFVKGAVPGPTRGILFIRKRK